MNTDAERSIIESRLEEQKKAGHIEPSLENLIDILSMYLKMSVDEVASKFTVRKFNNIIRFMSKFEEYKLLRGAELGGWAKFTNPVQHWISGFEKKDLFANANTDYKNSDLFNI